ncbi:MAG: hypothetical protein QXF12_05745 [Candidatus Aenigmatarchaeota archaeon]
MKGMSFSVKLILAVVVLAVGLLIYNKLQSWKCYDNLFNCAKKIEIDNYVDCVYRRCNYGCDNDQASLIALDDDVVCRDTCYKKWFLDQVDRDNEIYFSYSYCGLQYPLTVDLQGRSIILKDLKNVDCIILYNKNQFESIFDEPGNLIPEKRVLFVDSVIVEEYEEVKNGKCSIMSNYGFKEIDKVKLVDDSAYIYGGSENFIFKYSDLGVELKEIQNLKFFLSSDYYYKEAQNGKIAFVLGRYYPLDNQNGIVFAQPTTGINSLVYYYHCGANVVKRTILDATLGINFEICNKYRIYSDSVVVDQNMPLIFNIERI